MHFDFPYHNHACPDLSSVLSKAEIVNVLQKAMQAFHGNKFTLPALTIVEIKTHETCAIDEVIII